MDVSRVRRFVNTLAVIAVGCCWYACSAEAIVVHEPNGRTVGIALQSGVRPASIPGSFAAARAARHVRFSSDGSVDYNGGQVLHSSAPYLIFWDPTGQIPTSSRDQFSQYFVGVAADSGGSSNVYGVLRQYFDSTGFASYKQTFSPASQVINDTAPYPPADSLNCSASTPTCVTDNQLQAELGRVVTANGLPSGQGVNAPVYFMILPQTVNVCLPSAKVGQAPQCADNAFCAYHSVRTAGFDNVIYAAIPLLPLSRNPKSCQSDGNSLVQEPNSDGADVALKYLSHEDSEAITDPFFNAWFDSNPNSNGSEIGDNCNAFGAPDPNAGTSPTAFTPVIGGSATAGKTGNLYNQVIGDHLYYLQSEWSNGDFGCKLQPSAGQLSAGFSAPAKVPVGRAAVFDPSASSSTRGVSSVTWDLGDGRPTTFIAGAGLGRYFAAYSAPGTYTVTLTLVDLAGNLAAVSRQIQVGIPPTAAFTSSPNPAPIGAMVRFNSSASSDPNAGRSIRAYHWSFGDGAIGTGAAPSHRYPVAGTYTVSLSVTDGYGLTSAVISHRITVDEAPIPALAVRTRSPQVGALTAFSGAASHDSDGRIVSYHWRFGDGSVATGSDPLHTYRRRGIYSVALTVIDSGGVSAATTVRVSVQAGITNVSVRNLAQQTWLLVAVDGPGVVRLGRQTVHMRRPGTAWFELALSSAEHDTLSRRGKLELKLELQFAAATGAVERISRTVTLRP